MMVCEQQVWPFFNPVIFFFLPFLCQLPYIHAQLYNQKETSALLQFRQNFSFNKSASPEYCGDTITTSIPKMKSWRNGSHYCSWDGVDCDQTGQVIGLNLSCSWLQGTIHPNSSLFFSFPQLQKLDLSYNNFSMSPIPIEFARFSELTHLNLSESGFSGKVPLELSFLNKLVSLRLSSLNNNLRLEGGQFEFLLQNLSKLRDLDLGYVNMSSSVIPNSLLNLTSLRTLKLSSTGLNGQFPSGIFHLPYLLSLNIEYNNAVTGYLPNFMNLSYPLQYLRLSGTSFSGELPDSIANLKSLEFLKLCHCEFHGSIPTSLWNLTQIKYLALAYNNFSGLLPSSISHLRHLSFLDLSDNNLTGPLFSGNENLTELSSLYVSNNCLTGPLPSQVLAPPNLRYLDISQNMIDGTIPSWVFELPKLKYVDLGYNKLIGRIIEFQSPLLKMLALNNNKLHGTVPNSTFKKRNLSNLILSSNSFSGTILESNRCGRKLIVLQLQSNNFSGTIHDSFTKRNELEVINLEANGFGGPIPKSLINCTYLQMLDLGSNKFFEKFPHWLGNLPNLRVLILRSNKLYGSIQTSDRETKSPFPTLRVLDVSNNHFTGPLPIKYLKSFKAMMNVDEMNYHLEYLRSYGFFKFGNISLTMVLKGSNMEMKKILTIFAAIDLSRNKFQGEIPDLIGGLNSLRGLNLSHNSLTGHIPKSLGNLTKLEWLDLSSNMLTGEIPQQLTSLISLGTLNLSQNHLTGPIPRGKQFDTFLNDSYINNSALCGPPSSNTCGDPKEILPPQSNSEGDSVPVREFIWEAILPGYGFGLVVGLVMGYLMFSFGKPHWLVKMVESAGKRNREIQKSYIRRLGSRRN